MKRRDFLKGLFSVSMLPFFPCGLALARKYSRKELETLLPDGLGSDDVFAGITVDCLGRNIVIQETDWDEEGEAVEFDKYFVYRFHLTKNTEYLCDPSKVYYEAFAELDCLLVDLQPPDCRLDYIVDELKIYAEIIQEATRR
jgi:hypothetical protein